MKKLVILIMLVILVTSIAHAESLMSPTINNGSLEGSSDGYWEAVGNPIGWTYVGSSPYNYADGPGGHTQDGLASTELVGSNSYSDTKPIVYLFPSSTTISADTSYEMSFYVKKSDSWLFPAIKAVLGDGTKITLTPFLEAAISSTGDDWQKVTINTDRIYAGLAGKRIEISIWSWGNAIIDNVTVDSTALPPDSVETLMSPSINNGSLEGGIEFNYWSQPNSAATGWTYEGLSPWNETPGLSPGRLAIELPGATKDSLGNLAVAYPIVYLIPSYTITADTTYEISFWEKNTSWIGEWIYPALKAVNGSTKTTITTPDIYSTFVEGGDTWQNFTFNTGAVSPSLVGQQLEVSLWAWNAWYTIDNVTVTATYAAPTGFSLSGTVNLLDFSGDKTTIPVVVNLSGTDYPLNLDADGKFTILNVAAGTYDVYIKASHWLAKMTSAIDVSANTDIGTVNVINGDVVDNNEVDFSDINATRAAYGSFPGDGNWNERADVDGSLEVDFTDINIVRGNYGEIGD